MSTKRRLLSIEEWRALTEESSKEYYAAYVASQAEHAAFRVEYEKKLEEEGKWGPQPAGCFGTALALLMIGMVIVGFVGLVAMLLSGGF